MINCFSVLTNAFKNIITFFNTAFSLVSSAFISLSAAAAAARVASVTVVVSAGGTTASAARIWRARFDSHLCLLLFTT